MTTEPIDVTGGDGAAPFRLEPNALRCPYPHYETIRAAGPATWVDELSAYVVSDHRHVTELLRQPDLASSRMPTGPGLAATIGEAIDRGRAGGTIPDDAERYLAQPHPRTVFTIDPPEHTRMRKLVSRILTPRAARRFEPLVRAAADRLARDLAAHEGPVDAVAHFARPLPEQIILPLLRMPDHMVHELRQWTRALTFVIGNPEATDADVFEALSGRTHMMDFFAEHLIACRAESRDDLVTALIEASDDGRTLTEGERVGLLINLLVAGNETTIKATSSAMWILAHQPEVWSALVADPELIPTFVEEVLRLEPPTQGMFRQLDADHEIDGRVLPAHSHVYLNFAAANRDPAAEGEGRRGRRGGRRRRRG